MRLLLPFSRIYTCPLLPSLPLPKASQAPPALSGLRLLLWHSPLHPRLLSWGLPLHSVVNLPYHKSKAKQNKQMRTKAAARAASLSVLPLCGHLPFT